MIHTEHARILVRMLEWDGFKISRGKGGGMIVEGGGHSYDASFLHPEEAFLEAFLAIQTRINEDKRKGESDR